MTHRRNSQWVALFYALGIEGCKDSDIHLSAQLRASLHRYFIDNGLLFYRTDVADTAPIVVPHDENLNYQIPFKVHGTALGGHMGREKIYGFVSQHCWWPKLYKWVSA